MNDFVRTSYLVLFVLLERFVFYSLVTFKIFNDQSWSGPPRIPIPSLCLRMRNENKIKHVLLAEAQLNTLEG